MRTALMVIGIIVAPGVARLAMLWIVLPFAGVFRGWFSVLVPWLVVAMTAYFFRPVGPAVDGLYVGAYVWWMLCYVGNAVVLSLAIGAGVADRKLRDQTAKAIDRPGPPGR